MPNLLNLRYNNLYWQELVTSNLTLYLYAAYLDIRDRKQSGIKRGISSNLQGIQIFATLCALFWRFATHVSHYHSLGLKPFIPPCQEPSGSQHPNSGNDEQAETKIKDVLPDLVWEQHPTSPVPCEAVQVHFCQRGRGRERKQSHGQPSALSPHMPIGVWYDKPLSLRYFYWYQYFVKFPHLCKYFQKCSYQIFLTMAIFI